MEDRRAMEDVLRRSERRGAAATGEEKRVDSVGDDHKEEIAVKVGEKRPYNENNDKNQSSAKQKHLSYRKQELVLTNTKGFSSGPDSRSYSSNQKEQDDQLETARAEMGEVRQENQRLKMYLDRITKDYQALQMQFVNIVQQEAKKSIETSIDRDQEIEEPEQLVSLSLGRFSSDSKKDEKNKTSCPSKEDEEQVEEGLSLALDCKFEASTKSDANESLTNPSPAHSLEEPKEEAGETWPPSKVLNKKIRSGDDEILQQSPVKKARVSVRARCDTPTMNDGCQWRKYGQKIAKGNPCPRAYYRCTVAPSCPVRKQVQRCAEDMSILITTYEGTHNHPLPVSATAMASTTSAAASMLLSGSSSSSRPGSSTPSTAITAPNNLHGLNFYLSDPNSKSKQFFAPNSSSLSTSPLHTTITLDLTTTAPSSSSSSSHLSRFTSNYPQGPRYSSTNLNFSSSESSSIMSWGNGLLSYGSATQPYIKNNQIGSFNHGRQPIENIYQSYMQKNDPNPNPNLAQQPLPADTIEAATKAITADPSFRSALAAALKSIIGNGSGSGSGISSGGANQVSGDSFGQKLKWGEASSYSETVKGNGCGSSYLNKSSSTSSHHHPGSLIFMPPNSLQFSNSKSASSSPTDDREHAD